MNDVNTLLLVESRKKSPAVAALLNLFIAGAGHMYCGEWITGIVTFFIVVVVAVISAGILVIPLALLLIADGILAAGRYNKKVIKTVMAEQAEKEQIPDK